MPVVKKRCLKIRNRGLGTEQQGLCLEEIKLGNYSGFKLVHDQLQTVLLNLGVFLGKTDTFFQGTDIDVCPGDFGCQGDQDIIIICHGGQQVGIGRFNPPTKLSPEIHFPGSVKAYRCCIIITAVRRPGGADGHYITIHLLKLGKYLTFNTS